MATGAALIRGDRMIRFVQRQPGAIIINAQKGRTKRLLNLKIVPMFPQRTSAIRVPVSSLAKIGLGEIGAAREIPGEDQFE